MAHAVNNPMTAKVHGLKDNAPGSAIRDELEYPIYFLFNIYHVFSYISINMWSSIFLSLSISINPILN